MAPTPHLPPAGKVRHSTLCKPSPCRLLKGNWLLSAGAACALRQRRSSEPLRGSAQAPCPLRSCMHSTIAPPQAWLGQCNQQQHEELALPCAPGTRPSPRLEASKLEPGWLAGWLASKCGQQGRGKPSQRLSQSALTYLLVLLRQSWQAPCVGRQQCRGRRSAVTKVKCHKARRLLRLEVSSWKSSTVNMIDAEESRRPFVCSGLLLRIVYETPIGSPLLHVSAPGNQLRRSVRFPAVLSRLLSARGMHRCARSWMGTCNLSRSRTQDLFRTTTLLSFSCRCCCFGISYFDMQHDGSYSLCYSGCRRIGECPSILPRNVGYPLVLCSQWIRPIVFQLLETVSR